MAKPFLKWAGGKTSIKHHILDLIPGGIQRYIEPFLGGGAIFFSLNPQSAILSDVNAELINTYKIIKEDPLNLIRKLKGLKIDKENFYQIRALDRSLSYLTSNATDQAARLVYLNKTCFNGLYRVNSKGQFNTPYGDYKNPSLFDRENLLACSEALQTADIRNCSYLELEEGLNEGDFLYLDPPYLPISDTSNFTSYSASSFTLKDHEELAGFCHRISERGIRFLLSNSASEKSRELYQDFQVKEIKARRSINSDASKRQGVTELLVYNYKT